ncbi:MAG TPA: diaminopimelate decarboxylase [Mizugakiibacter sp.]
MLQTADPSSPDAAETPPAAAPAALDGVDLHALAARLGTPLYVYSAAAIRTRLAALHAALASLDAQVCYAVKANPNRAVLALMAEAGLGADIVSVGELWRALCAGIPASRIVFSGVGKTAEDIDAALAAGILRFNVESYDELQTLRRRAAARGAVAHAAVRVNPDVDARTHAKISTGRAENKFGVGLDEARGWFAERSDPHLRLDGLHVHIGSQILSVEPFRQALARVDAFRRELEAAGHAIRSIDVGGGLGVTYREGCDRPVAIEDYAAAIRAALAGYDGRLLLEPGRWLVAEAGVLLTRVIRIKPGALRPFLILDAAMNDLARPSLYDAWHDIVPVGTASQASERYDVVGPVCETGDTFARDRLLPACAPGDLLMIRGAGAYGASMASTYNSRPLIAEAMIDAGRYAVVRRRQSLEEMVAGESLAAHRETA